MQDHSNWMDLPEVAVVPTRGEDISPAYVLAEKKRNAFGDLKKMLALLTPTVASIYKNSASRSMTKPEDTERVRNTNKHNHTHTSQQKTMQQRVIQGILIVLTSSFVCFFFLLLQLALIDGLISQEAARRDELLVSLKAFQSQPGLAPTESEFGATLEKILTTVPPSDCYDQPTHVTWNDMTKKLSQNLFREQSKFLEQMKAEKKKKLAEK